MNIWENGIGEAGILQLSLRARCMARVAGPQCLDVAGKPWFQHYCRPCVVGRNHAQGPAGDSELDRYAD